MVGTPATIVPQDGMEIYTLPSAQDGIKQELRFVSAMLDVSIFIECMPQGCDVGCTFQRDMEKLQSLSVMLVVPGIMDAG